MAGGKGTRISSLFPDIPKPLIPIENKNGIIKPVLEWEIESLKSQGFTDIILTVSYLHKKIESYFGDGSKFGVNIEYFIEETPLGNAGALFRLRDKFGDEPFLLLIADAMFDVDFRRMVKFHLDKKAQVTLFTHPNSHPFDSSVLEVDSQGRVIKWMTKEYERPRWYKNRVNAGLQVIDPRALDEALKTLVSVSENFKLGMKQESITKVDMDRHILKPLCVQGCVWCYDSPEYCKDMGTPERYKQVEKDFQNGLVSAKNLKNRQKAIFLDRDGTINRHVGFLKSPEEFELLPGVAEAIRKINSSGYLAIVVTNQPVIARGEVTKEGLQIIHNKMETLLGEQGAYLDGLYYCPHHPHKGYPGEIEELKIECNCRKPKPGLILQAVNDFNIDVSESWMIGDGENDIGAGKNAGCKTALITENIEEECSADFADYSLLDIVNKILA